MGNSWSSIESPDDEYTEVKKPEDKKKKNKRSRTIKKSVTDSEKYRGHIQDTRPDTTNDIHHNTRSSPNIQEFNYDDIINNHNTKSVTADDACPIPEPIPPKSTTKRRKTVKFRDHQN